MIRDTDYSSTDFTGYLTGLLPQSSDSLALHKAKEGDEILAYSSALNQESHGSCFVNSDALSISSNSLNQYAIANSNSFCGINLGKNINEKSRISSCYPADDNGSVKNMSIHLPFNKVALTLQHPVAPANIVTETFSDFKGPERILSYGKNHSCVSHSTGICSSSIEEDELMDFKVRAVKAGFLVDTALDEVRQNSHRLQANSSSRISNNFRSRHGYSVSKPRNAYLQVGVRVPSKDHVSEIVGKGGQKIKQLRDETGALITTPGEDEEHVFMIEAVPEVALHVAHIIHQRALDITHAKTAGCERRRDSFSTLITNRVLLYKDTIDVPQKIVGKIIGTQGSIITTIQKDTGTEIKSPPKEELKECRSTPCFEIAAYQSATLNGVDVAKQQILLAKQLICHLVVRQIEKERYAANDSSEVPDSSGATLLPGLSFKINNDSGSNSYWHWPEGVPQMEAAEARAVLERILTESKNKTRRARENAATPVGSLFSLPSVDDTFLHYFSLSNLACSQYDSTVPSNESPTIHLASHLRRGFLSCHTTPYKDVGVMSLQPSRLAATEHSTALGHYSFGGSGSSLYSNTRNSSNDIYRSALPTHRLSNHHYTKFVSNWNGSTDALGDNIKLSHAERENQCFNFNSKSHLANSCLAANAASLTRPLYEANGSVISVSHVAVPSPVTATHLSIDAKRSFDCWNLAEKFENMMNVTPQNVYRESNNNHCFTPTQNASKEDVPRDSSVISLHDTLYDNKPDIERQIFLRSIWSDTKSDLACNNNRLEPPNETELCDISKNAVTTVCAVARHNGASFNPHFAESGSHLLSYDNHEVYNGRQATYQHSFSNHNYGAVGEERDH